MIMVYSSTNCVIIKKFTVRSPAVWNIAATRPVLIQYVADVLNMEFVLEEIMSKAT